MLRISRPVLLPALLLACTYFLSSCSVQKTGNSQSEIIKVYPSPPDTTRIQYLTTISSSAVISGKQSGFSRFLLGNQEPIAIVKPYGIASQGSEIYICDTGIGGIVIIDLAKRTFRQFIPEGKGQLQLPLNCAVDTDGNLYIADGNRRQVVVFDNNGNYLDAFGETTDGFKPTGVAVTKDAIYVSSISDHRVYIYNKNLPRTIRGYLGGVSGANDYLYQPANIYYRDGNIFVSDVGDYRVKVFGEEGSFIRLIGSYGNNSGQFMRPKGVAADRDMNTYVVDAAFENVQIFNSTGQLLMFFGGAYRSPGDMWLPADVTIDYDNIDYFSRFVDPEFELQYLIWVTNQYGPGKIGVYGFVKQK
ncbi:MAG: hypothetical protein E4G95_02675 [Bacteroidia bacterium]|nr:MAG: hypothetical protein E4G95_02675 [Bacteroidia bacterium]